MQLLSGVTASAVKTGCARTYFSYLFEIPKRIIVEVVKNKASREFYGATTVGAKGQVVIPAEARKAMDLKDGDKLLVFGMGCDMVAFSKLSNVERFATHLSKKLIKIRSVLRKAAS